MKNCKWYCIWKPEKEIKSVINKKILWYKLTKDESKIFKVCKKSDCKNEDYVKKVNRLYSEMLVNLVEKNLY